MEYYHPYLTRIGIVSIQADETSITQVSFGELDEFPRRETPLIKEAYKQLNEYLKGERKVFDLPLNPKGTPFQKKVWEALRNIPFGETRSYKQVAEAVESPQACRAVGMANNKNPIAIIIPCHRVIGADGKLIGYAGGLGVKEELLRIEKVIMV